MCYSVLDFEGGIKVKNARLYKIFDWIALGLAYISVLLVITPCWLDSVNLITADLRNGIMIGGLVFYILLLLLQIALYVLACFSSAITNESIVKHNMVVKLVSIPFFVLNVVACYFVAKIAGEINVFLFPLTIAVLVFTTYVIMLRSSISNIVYFVKRYIKKKFIIDPIAIIAIVLSFFFCLDAISGIVLFLNEKTQAPEGEITIQERKVLRAQKRVENWNKKKHISLNTYKIFSIIGTVISYIASITLIVFVILAGVNIAQESSNVMDTIPVLVFIISPICLGIAAILKFIMAFIYGKKGEEDPIKFVSIMKIVDSVPAFLTLVSAVVYLILGSLFGWMIIIGLLFLVVVIMIFVVLGSIGISAFSYFFAAELLASALFFIWGDSLTLFNYYMEQRLIKNKKFSRPLVVMCLVFLWIPLLDMPATFILKSLSKKDDIYSDKQVISY